MERGIFVIMKLNKALLFAVVGLIIAGGAVALVLFARSDKIKNVQAVISSAPQIQMRPTAQDFAPLPRATSTSMDLPILMYHHIGYVPTGTVDSIRIGLTVSPQEFAQQVSWLKSQGYTSISLNDLYLYTQKRFTMPKKPVIFTFDDGYDDAFTNGTPILRQYGYTGLFGIITHFPGTTSGTNTYADWGQIAAAKRQGMEIICHTENHFDGSNPKYDTAYIYQNLSSCQQALQNHLGAAEPYLMYPYGHYNADYLAQAKNLSFVMGMTVHDTAWVNLNDLMELPRVRVSPGEPLDKFIERLTE